MEATLHTVLSIAVNSVSAQLKMETLTAQDGNAHSPVQGYNTYSTVQYDTTYSATNWYTNSTCSKVHYHAVSD